MSKKTTLATLLATAAAAFLARTFSDLKFDQPDRQRLLLPMRPAAADEFHTLDERPQHLAPEDNVSVAPPPVSPFAPPFILGARRHSRRRLKPLVFHRRYPSLAAGFIVAIQSAHATSELKARTAAPEV